ncbi:GNAT family N-acetyltransferase [Falsiruegeria mediterranea]|uniref:N-acetyltransferase domain-containing protein n=1 Tax=Falsiruegeria mediterranea M17 TaxID=1200281 RepID=A0A2R8C5D1_9RHOB|nr:hypothetical protein TRM7615_01139 [Falsiruegeria mediterranea M17]
MYNIRPAAIQDVDSIARIHVACWGECYPYLPLGLHEMRGLGYRQQQWGAELSTGGVGGTLVLLDGDRVVGFSHVQPNNDRDIPEADIELHACYFLPEYRRSLAGPQMLQRMVGMVLSQGWLSCCLWAWSKNPVRRTYGALGFKPVVRRDRTIGDFCAPEVGYLCQDLPVLNERLSKSLNRLSRRDVQTRNQQYSKDRFRPIALRSGKGQ